MRRPLNVFLFFLIFLLVFFNTPYLVKAIDPPEPVPPLGGADWATNLYNELMEVAGEIGESFPEVTVDGDHPFSVSLGDELITDSRVFQERLRALGVSEYQIRRLGFAFRTAGARFREEFTMTIPAQKRAIREDMTKSKAQLERLKEFQRTRIRAAGRIPPGERGFFGKFIKKLIRAIFR